MCVCWVLVDVMGGGPPIYRYVTQGGLTSNRYGALQGGGEGVKIGDFTVT